MPNPIKHTSQAIDNLSFDETYNEATTLMVGEDTTNGVLRRVQVDATGKLDINASIDTTGLATSAIQTGGTQKTQVVDAGGDAVTVTGGKLDVNASVDTTGLATSANQLPDGHNVTVDNPGDIGGGTQYTEGDVDATITGTAAMVEGAANALAVMTQPLTDTQLRAADVKITLDGESVPVTGTFYQATQPVSGTVTAELSATDNAVLDQIELNTDPLLVVGGGTEATAQRVTIANDSTGVVSVDDNGGALTVDGTVTANLSATDNAVLDAIEADTTTIAGAVAGTEMQVDVITMPTVTVTATNLDVQSGGADLATSAQGAAIQTAVETIDNAISGSEMQVDVVGSLPAGTNAIGKLVANSGVDIGDVDVASIATGTNAIGRVGHDITGVGHGVKTVTTAGTDVALAASTVCKKVDIQAQTDNTSIIAVGGSGVDATVATGTGIVLNPGECYSLEIDNLADIYIDSLVNGEGARFTYFT
jgi:hypothetical protein